MTSTASTVGMEDRNAMTDTELLAALRTAHRAMIRVQGPTLGDLDKVEKAIAAAVTRPAPAVGEAVAWRWAESGTDTDGDPRIIKGVFGDYEAALTLSRMDGSWSATINRGHGKLGFRTPEDAQGYAERQVAALLDARLRSATVTMSIYAAPSTIQIGDDGAAIYTQAEFDEAGEIGERDGYESAIQDIDLATGGDGEFYGSTIDGGVDVPVMKQRIIDRFAALASPPVGRGGIAEADLNELRVLRDVNDEMSDGYRIQESDDLSIGVIRRCLDALGSRPALSLEDDQGSFSQEAKIPTEGQEAAVVGGQIAWRSDAPPKDGSVFYGHWWSPCRWLAYKPNSEQARRGIKGRWQTMTEYGGWGNAATPNEWATKAQIDARQQAAVSTAEQVGTQSPLGDEVNPTPSQQQEQGQ
jgi:hypothetical protein